MLNLLNRYHQDEIDNTVVYTHRIELCLVHLYRQDHRAKYKLAECHILYLYQLRQL